jgi:hypothetical protein
MTRDGAVRCACTDAIRTLTLELLGCRVTVYGASRRPRVKAGPGGMHSAPTPQRAPNREVMS